MKPNPDAYLSVAVVESDGYLYLRTDADDTPRRKELRYDEYRAYAHGRTNPVSCMRDPKGYAFHFLPNRVTR